jgi:hypothetical protein
MLWQNHSKINQNLWVMNRYNKDTTREERRELYLLRYYSAKHQVYRAKS